jgi:NDP-sugar pyrophosphorylase family protein
MEVILLAGGLGTRLRSVVSDRPKPLADVCGRPFISYLVRSLARQGFTDIIFAVGYMGGMIEDTFGDGSAYGIRASYAVERELLGTAGAIRNAARCGRGDEFLILNADTFYQMDYRPLCDLAESGGYDLSLVLRRVPDIRRYGEARLRGTRLVSFNEKTAEERPGTINGGIYLMRRELIGTIPEGKVSLENEMIPRWLREGRPLGGIVNDGYFIDIGVPEDYRRFCEDVRKGTVTY